MGWAVFLAHSALQAIFSKGVADIQPGAQLIDGLPTPQFNVFSKLFWLYSDDFSVTQPEERGQDPAVLDVVNMLRQRRAAITNSGLRVHKEVAGYGIPASLGTEVV